MANWPRVDANDPGGAPAYARRTARSASPTSRARRSRPFTVAGALEDGPRHARHEVRPRAADPGRRPHDRRVARARLRDADDRADPRPVEQRRRDHDRPARGQASASTSGCAASASASRPASTCPARSAASSCRVSKYSGSSMGNLPIGQGIAVTPMQMATRLRGDRQRRHPAHAADRPRASTASACATPTGTRVISRAPPPQLRTMLEGVLAPGGTASEVSIPGYKLAGKTGTANKVDPTTGEYSKSRYVASFVGFAPGAAPEAARRGHGRRAAGRDLRRHGRGAGVRADRGFALPYLRIPPG